MKKLIFIILFLPFFVKAQINGTLQKTVTTGVIRGTFGPYGLDTLANVKGSLTNTYMLRYSSALKGFQQRTPSQVLSDIGGQAAISLAAIGSSPNANGATLSSGTFTMQPASGSFGGVVTTGAQTFAGLKTFSDALTVDGGDLTIRSGGGIYFYNVGNTNFTGLFANSAAGFNATIPPLTANRSFAMQGQNASFPTVTGDLTGNASTATALQTARTIGGVSFNGTANITVASATGGFSVTGGNLVASGAVYKTAASGGGFTTGQVQNLGAVTNLSVYLVTVHIRNTDNTGQNGLYLVGRIGTGDYVIPIVDASDVTVAINGSDEVTVTNSSGGNRIMSCTMLQTHFE